MTQKNNRTTRVLATLLATLLSGSHLSANTYFNQAAQCRQQGDFNQAIANYKKSIELDPDHFESHFYLATTYFVLGYRDQAITEYKKAASLRPDSAQTQFNLALAHQGNNDYNASIQALEKALHIAPHYKKAKVFLGNAYLKKGNIDHALTLYDEVLAADPINVDALENSAGAYREKNEFDQAVTYYKRAIEQRPNNLHANFNLAYTYHRMGDLENAIDTYRTILSFSPDCTDARCNLAHMLRYVGHVDEAINQYEKTLKAAPDNPHVHYGYAESLLKAGQFEHGWEEFEYRWKRDANSRNFSDKLWDGSDLMGKTILVRAEYGHGDTIQFIRFTKHLKEMGATVIAEVQGALKKLLSGCPYVDKLIVVGQQLPEFDAQVPVMSLPHKLGIFNEEEFATGPYIDADQEIVHHWKSELARDGKFKIGICWEGSTYFDSLRGPRSKKALHLRTFKALSELPNVTLYCLQKTEARNQMNEVDFEVRDLGPDFDGSSGRYMDTAALMKTLDLVVTVDTSVAHLAGALGVPVWVVLPTVADWRWMLDCDDTPWYSTMRLFRQETYGDWDSVFAQIKTSLGKKLQERVKKSDIVSAEISIGELIDKITILQLKNKYIKNEAKLKNVRKELAILCTTRDEKVAKCKELDELTEQLYAANQRLWDIEDACRDKERLKEFDDEFIQITRSVYINNDERCALKRKINTILGSNLVEEKSYAAY